MLTHGTAPVRIQVFEESNCICDDSYKEPVPPKKKESSASALSAAKRNPEGYSLSAIIRIPKARPWTTEDPFLYTLKIQFGDDHVESYFAMRSFTVEPDEKGIPRFCLNHSPLFLHGVLDQGYWPDGL